MKTRPRLYFIPGLGFLGHWRSCFAGGQTDMCTHTPTHTHTHAHKGSKFRHNITKNRICQESPCMVWSHIIAIQYGMYTANKCSMATISFPAQTPRRGVRRNWLRGGCGKSQTALLLKIFLGTGQPQGLLYLTHWEAQPQAKPINRNDF